MLYLVPIGRFLYSAIFLMTVLGHFSAGYIGYAAQAGVPAPGLLVPLSGVIATLGGLSITPDSGTKSPGAGTPAWAAYPIYPAEKCPNTVIKKIAEYRNRPIGTR